MRADPVYAVFASSAILRASHLRSSPWSLAILLAGCSVCPRGHPSGASLRVGRGAGCCVSREQSGPVVFSFRWETAWLRGSHADPSSQGVRSRVTEGAGVFGFPGPYRLSGQGLMGPVPPGSRLRCVHGEPAAALMPSCGARDATSCPTDALSS